MNLNIVKIVIVCFFLRLADAACSDFPSVFDGSWYDSQYHEETTKGMITFLQSQKKITTGWYISCYGFTMNSFSCVLSSSGLLVFQSTSLVNLFGENYYFVVCIGITKQTPYSYMYYRRGALNEESCRLTALRFGETLSTSTSTYCSGTAATEDFGVLVQDGHYSDVAITSPNPFLSVSKYSFTIDGKNFKCSTTSLMDGCTDKTVVKLNTTLCNEVLLDANNRRFYAVAYAVSGSTYYIAMMHNNTVATTTHRSTCVVATISGYNVTASTDPGSCKVGQNSTSRTSNAASVLIKMKAYEICYSSASKTRSMTFFSLTSIVSAVLVCIVKQFIL